MSREYAERRIKDALRQAGGNATRARQQIIAWTYEDAKLLHALTRPHLTGIVAYNIERILSGRADEKPDVKKSQQSQTDEEKFGMEILRAVASADAALFGQETAKPQARRGKASKQHIDAIRQIASKSKTKPKK